MNKNLCVLFVLFIFNIQAKAEQESIVYINFNNTNALKSNASATDEISVVKKIAKEKNLKLIIIPNDNRKSMGAKELCENLKNVATNPGKISSLIFSGHDGGGGFGGVNGSVFYPDLKRILEMPDISKKIKDVDGLYLWGCYTNTTARAMGWEQLINNGVIAGFDDKSPLNGDPRNANTLYNLMNRQTEIKNDANGNKILNEINRANKLSLGVLVRNCDTSNYWQYNKKTFNFDSTSLDTSICSQVQGEITKAKDTIRNYRYCGLSAPRPYTNTMYEASMTAESMPNSPPSKNNIPEAKSAADCSFFEGGQTSAMQRLAAEGAKKTAESGAVNAVDCEEIPADYPSSDSRYPGILRGAYEVMRRREQCLSIPGKEVPHEDMDSTILLVKGPHVLSNYRLQFRSELMNACKKLPGCGAPATGDVDGSFLKDFLDNKPVSRSRWLKGINQLSKSNTLKEETEKQYSDKNMTMKATPEELRKMKNNLAKYISDNYPLGALINSSDTYILNNSKQCQDVTWTDDWSKKNSDLPCSFSGEPRQHFEIN